MRRMALIFYILLAFFYLSACTESPSNGDGTSFIPDVEAACSVTQAAACSGAGYTVYIGLIGNLAIRCDTYLGSITSATQFTQSFDASGTAVAAQTSYLTATVSAWVDNSGATIGSLNENTQRACSFVDVNSNQRLDANEPVGQGDITPGVTGAQINDWVAY